MASQGNTTGVFHIFVVFCFHFIEVYLLGLVNFHFARIIIANKICSEHFMLCLYIVLIFL